MAADIHAMTNQVSALITCLLIFARLCHGVIEMKVSPYPARVYTLAPEDLPVLTVQGRDNITGEAVTSFRLENSIDARFFKIDSQGVLRTAKPITFTVGRVITFFVFGSLNNQSSMEISDLSDYKHVKIEVSEKNQFPPVFETSSYHYSVYRYGVADIVGQVFASDKDTQNYNREFDYRLEQGEPASEYISVEPNGVLRLSRPIPDTITNMTFRVLATDHGSPQMTGTTVVKLDAILVKQPDVFCFSTTPSTITLCWKNPTPEVPFEGYTITVSGAQQGGDYLPAILGHTEACYTLNDTRVGQQYIFRVKVDTKEYWFGSDFDIIFNKTGIGYSRDCIEDQFSYCSYRQPCHGHGLCTPSALPSAVSDYTCECDPGWAGENCTIEDMCQYSPCQNNGKCQFDGDGVYHCECLVGYAGPKCEFEDLCQSSPCENGGSCSLNKDGDFLCDCTPGFKGRRCEEPNPCDPFPCNLGRSECVPLSDTTYRCDCIPGYYGNQCNMIDACATNPCQYHGTCTNVGDTFRCDCPPGSGGQRCELFDPCFVNPCQNLGTCSVSDTGSYMCQCVPGFSGKECQNQDPCQGVNCNNGTCETSSSNERKCVCEPGFFGASCEKFDICKLEPCGNHGQCRSAIATNTNNSDNSNSKSNNNNNNNNGNNDNNNNNGTRRRPFECDCSPDWYGDSCEFFNLCASGPCQNGGTCTNVPPNGYECTCQVGYVGDNCAIFDPCVAHDCQNAATCLPNQTEYTCACADGWMGEKCQVRDPCSSGNNPCQNLARCVVVASLTGSDLQRFSSQSETPDSSSSSTPSPSSSSTTTTTTLQTITISDPTTPNQPTSRKVVARETLIEVYRARCDCPDDFVGLLCEFFNPCRKIVSPCVKGDCELIDFTAFSTQDSFTTEVGVADAALSTLNAYPQSEADIYRCVCDDGYTGRDCSIRIVTCGNIQCLNGGVCKNNMCECPPDYTGDHCEIEKCVESSSQSEECFCEGENKTCIHFCQKSDLPSEFITRQLTRERFQVSEELTLCSLSCEEADSSSCERARFLCRSKDTWQASYLTNNEPCRSTLPQIDDYDALSQLNDLLDGTKNPLSLSAANVSIYAEKLISLSSEVLLNTTYADMALQIISNLASVAPNVSESVEKSGQTSNKDLRAFVDNYTADVEIPPGGSVVAGQNSQVRLEVMTLDSALSENETQYRPFGDDQVFIKLPQSKLLAVSRARPGSRVQFVAYNRSQLFVPSKGFPDRDLLPRQMVISATVGEGRNMQKINFTGEPVEIRLKKLIPEENHTCAFWDEEEAAWSTEGVTIEMDDDQDFVTCKSEHLTSFAVLLSSTAEALPVAHEEALSYITYIGCAISMAALVLTIVTYALFRVLNCEKSGKTLLNLCTALLLLNIIFLVGSIDVGHFSETSCVAIALIMHFLVLASLMWMLVEAVQMYQALVTVFTSYETLYLVRRCILAWGLPVIIVIITAAIDITSYENPVETRKVCYLNTRNLGAYYGALVAPACLIVLINTVIFIIVSRVILKPRFQQPMANEDSAFLVTPAQVRGAFTVMFLLGITWIFGPLAVDEAKLVFSYLFCICNSLQGFLIFVFRCLLNPEAKLAWIQLFQTGTLKRRRGPIKSVYTDTSSSKGGAGHDAQGRRLSNSTSAVHNVAGNFSVASKTTFLSKNGVSGSSGTINSQKSLNGVGKNGIHSNGSGVRRGSEPPNDNVIRQSSEPPNDHGFRQSSEPPNDHGFRQSSEPPNGHGVRQGSESLRQTPDLEAGGSRRSSQGKDTPSPTGSREDVVKYRKRRDSKPSLKGMDATDELTHF